MWTRAELKENAKKFFKFNYWKMVLVAFIMTMIVGGGSGASAGSSQCNSDGIGGAGSADVTEIIAFIVAFLVIFLVMIVIAFALDISVF